MFHLLKIRLYKIIFLACHYKYLYIYLKFRVCPSLENLSIIKNLNFTNFIDVGANNGQFLLLIDYLYPNKTTFAFEPIQLCYNNLKNLFQNNKYIRIYNVALGSKNKTEVFYVTENNDSSSFYKPIWNKYKVKESLSIDVKTGAKMLKKSFLKNSLVKIDVQGYELEVLKGFSESIVNIKYILIELSSVQMYANQPLFKVIDNFLLKKNFKCIKITNYSYDINNLLQADYLYVNNSTQ
jgi:FkbM family methyltransferase